MAKNKVPKTNALRLLDYHGIKYEVRTYEAPDGFLDGLSVAKQVGMDPGKYIKPCPAGHDRGVLCLRHTGGM